MKTIKGNWIMEKDEVIEEDLNVEGGIFGKDGKRFNLKVKGNLDCKNLNCWNLDCWDLDCKNLNCWNLDCWNLNCWNLDCWNLNCWNLNCWNLNCWNLNCKNLNCKNLNCKNLNCRDLSFYAVAIAYKSFKCETWKAERDKFVIQCLDGKVIGKEKGK